MEQWVTIRTLKKQNSELGTRQIADLLGVSRNTVKRALRSEGEPKYVRTPVVNPDLHPFEEYIFEQRFVKRLRGSRILNDLRSKGYRGSQSAFYRYLCTLQDPVKRTFKRYETAPGEQAQFDWSEYTVLLAGILTKVYVFIFILGFSRYRKYRGSLSETQGSIFEAMEKSLYAVGGVTERVQTDNAGSFVVKRAGGGYHWNPRYLAFAAHFGFQVSRSEFGHPWSKGKVENPFDYLPHVPAAAYPEPLRSALAPYLEAENPAGPVSGFAAAIAAAEGRGTLPFLMALNQRMFETFRHVTRDDGPAHPPEITLRAGEGTCRDMAVLFCSACRTMGIAARFVSGYEREAALQERADMHAWAEVYLPGGGWRGYDPSQGLAVATSHVAVAAAADPRLASPISGLYRGDARSEMQFTISMEVEESQ